MVGAWCFAVIAAAIILFRADTRPAPLSKTPTLWPIDCPLNRRPGTPTLVVSLHPKCVCTPATLDALEQYLLSHADNQVLFLATIPMQNSENWLESTTCRRARRIAGATLIADPEARIASSFGMHASGHVCAYSADGRLRFTGGLTPSRGHKATPAAVAALLDHDGGQPDAAPVFGCTLVGCEEAGGDS